MLGTIDERGEAPDRVPAHRFVSFYPEIILEWTFSLGKDSGNRRERTPFANKITLIVLHEQGR